MSNNFKRAFRTTFNLEGGYVDDKVDNGGATNFGISMRFLKSLPVDKADINGDGQVTIADIEALKPEHAKEFYEKYFWNPCRCSEMHGDVAVLHFDAAVNSGNKQANKLLQRALNSVGGNLVVDGACGLKTVGAVNAACCNGKDGLFRLCVAMLNERQQFYNGLANDRSQRTFHLGWTRRVSHLLEMTLHGEG